MVRRVTIYARAWRALTTTHVVGLAVRLEDVGVLAPELEEGDGQNDLPLGHLRSQVPHLLRRDVSGNVVPRALGRPVNAVGVDNVANEAKHGDPAVLDLRLAQEANRRRVRVTPELTLRKVERVEEADDRVQLLGLILQAGQVHHLRRGRTRHSGHGGHGRRVGQCRDGRQHFWLGKATKAQKVVSEIMR